MKIQIISDIHREFGASDLSFDHADLVVLAGDVDIGTKGIDWILNTIPDKPVIYVLGNHEYYKGDYPGTLQKIQTLAKGTHVSVLENESITIEGICFHCTTLWTDFSLLGDPRTYGAICQNLMNDYKRIRRSGNYSRLRSVDTFHIHQKSMVWLEESLSKSETATNIVVTHHAPSILSVPEAFKNDPVSAAYASNLEEFIQKHKPNYWIHGHIHTPATYKIADTTVICNPHGYIDEPYNGYQKELIIEV